MAEIVNYKVTTSTSPKWTVMMIELGESIQTEQEGDLQKSLYLILNGAIVAPRKARKSRFKFRFRKKRDIKVRYSQHL